MFKKKGEKKTATAFSSKSGFSLSKKGVKNKFGMRFEADIVTDLSSSQSIVFQRVWEQIDWYNKNWVGMAKLNIRNEWANIFTGPN